MTQKSKDKVWKDETGREIPMQYISAANKLRERHAATLLKGAKDIHGKLKAYKVEMDRMCLEVYAKAMEDFKAEKETKGNFTWFNFDRSIKIEVSISDRIQFDDLAIDASKQKLDQFLDENVTTKMEFVKELVQDAFSTSRGKIDAKKVFQLMRYRTKIQNPLFQEAIDILEKGITNPGSRKYFRIWERDADGGYQVVDLNFSSI